MLINLAAMLRMAEEKKIAVGSFNVCNVESLQAVWRAARDSDTPVIISFGEAYDRHMPLEGMAALVRELVAPSPLPAVLHLDHSKEKKTILRALAAGFTSVMFDGSALPLDENIRRSREMAEMAHILDASLEGELGYMNPEDGTGGDASRMGECTRVSDARQYAVESGADALAIAMGMPTAFTRGRRIWISGGWRRSARPSGSPWCSTAAPASRGSCCSRLSGSASERSISIRRSPPEASGPRGILWKAIRIPTRGLRQ